MTDYKIVTHRDTSTLEKEVNKLLKKGYQLHGGLIHSLTDSGAQDKVHLFSQALIKEDKVVENKVTIKKDEVVISGNAKITTKDTKKSQTKTVGFIPEFLVHKSGTFMFVEFLDIKGEAKQFIMKSCHSTEEQVRKACAKLYAVGNLNPDGLKKEGIVFDGFAREV